MQTADLGFQFALQVRNKVIGAYEEIMRMQV
jgi:flagellar hook-basal body complex protein FliE